MGEEIAFSGFDWDKGNLAHATRHGISRQQIEQAVLSGLKVIAAYERNGEVRYAAVGATADGLPIHIAFTIRSGRLRPIAVHKLKRSKRKLL